MFTFTKRVGGIRLPWPTPSHARHVQAVYRVRFHSDFLQKIHFVFFIINFFSPSKFFRDWSGAFTSVKKLQFGGKACCLMLIKASRAEKKDFSKKKNIHYCHFCQIIFKNTSGIVNTLQECEKKFLTFWSVVKDKKAFFSKRLHVSPSLC